MVYVAFSVLVLMFSINVLSQAGRQTDRQTDKHISRHTDKKTANRKTSLKMERQADRKTGRQEKGRSETDRQETDRRQTDRQAKRQTDKISIYKCNHGRCLYSIAQTYNQLNHQTLIMCKYMSAQLECARKYYKEKNVIVN